MHLLNINACELIASLVPISTAKKEYTVYVERQLESNRSCFWPFVNNKKRENRHSRTLSNSRGYVE